MPDVAQSWHAQAPEEVIRCLGSSRSGLSADEARRRLESVGPNVLQAAHRASPWRLLAAQFSNVLIVILLVATALSAVLGHVVEAVAITVIVLFAVLLGFVQEFRAERAIDALREMAAPRATVVRDGEEVELPAREVVPGDLLVLNAGNRDRRRRPAGAGGQPEGAGSGPHRRIDADPEARRHALCRRRSGRRPTQHGVCRDRP